MSVMFVQYTQIAKGINTISFAHHSSMSHPDRVKIWFTSVNPSSPNFALQSDPPTVDVNDEPTS